MIYAAFAILLLLTVWLQTRRHLRQEALARQAAGLSPGEAPRAQHPHIRIDQCIGCGGCVSACPEGDVLAVLAGKAALINGHKCIGHGLCADACPVGAIEIVMATPTMTDDLPILTPELETNVPNLFVAGELGGLALIKNAINQGRDCIDRIAERLTSDTVPVVDSDTLDVAIIGAGPAGLAASLRAVELGLRFVTLEAEQLGGTVAKYPRQKLVMTSPVTLPIYGRFSKLEISKEKLLEIWEKTALRAGASIRSRERVEAIVPGADGRFAIRTTGGAYVARTVVMAIGKRGSPRKLGIPGESLPHVMYSLLDAEAYRGARIVVVGGGDSAVEAAMGLAHQPGNQVTISYRKAAFSRLKDRNEKRLRAMIGGRQLTVIFESQPREISETTVTLDVGGIPQQVPADYVWIFAGGAPAGEFLAGIGIAVGSQDLSGAVQSELASAGSAATPLPAARSRAAMT